MIAYFQRLEKKKHLLERDYLFEELKKCYLCNFFIEKKYVKICCLYFHKECLLEELQDL